MLAYGSANKRCSEKNTIDIHKSFPTSQLHCVIYRKIYYYLCMLIEKLYLCDYNITMCVQHQCTKLPMWAFVSTLKIDKFVDDFVD